MPATPAEFSKTTQAEIEQWADTPDDEYTALKAHLPFLRDDQIERITKLDRWLLAWTAGKARWRSRMNKSLEESKDPAIKKVIAEHTLPKIEVIEDGYEFIIDAPEWWRKKNKIKR